MKEKHQAIAEGLFTSCVQGHNSIKTDLHAITAALDAAHADGDKAGYERGVRESAEAARKYTHNVYNSFVAQEVEKIVLSLLAPPVPVWCPHATKSEGGWQFTLDGNVHWSDYTAAFVCCPICGAKKPEPKGN